MPTPKISVQDADAFSDHGSTISLASAGSDGDGFSPRPPSGKPRRARSAQGRKSRAGAKSSSPYASQQFRGTQSRPQSASRPSNRSLWLSAMKNGTGTLSTENTGMNTWAGSRPAHANKKRGPGNRTRGFSDVVEVATGKSRTHTRSATLSYTEPIYSGSGPAYKPPEDYYDEVIELKKIINTLKQENNILNTKLHRTEQENVLRDKQIDDLLNARKQPEDMRRTLTDKKGDTSAIVNSLKQKLHAVERQVKEKESELSKLKSDMKLTDSDEMSLQTEMYYQEVQRLQLALLEQQQASVQLPLSSRSVESKTGRGGRRAVSASVQQAQDEIEMLKAENRSLKKDMMTLIENQSKGKDKKKPFNVEYADMSRAQLLQTIHELETKSEDEKRKDKSKSRSKAHDNTSSDEDKPATTRKHSKDIEGKLELRGSTAQKLSQLQTREGELLDEQQKQRHVIERLKEDRTHYRNVADELRQKLQAAEDELERRRGESTTDRPVAGERSRTGSAVSRTGSVVSTASQYSPRKPFLRAKEREEQMERELEEFQQRHAAKTLQKQWRQYRGQRKVEEERQKYEQEEAAHTLQKQWRRHRDNRQWKEKAAQEEAVTDIQSVLRGHAVRRQRLDNELYEPDSDDAVVDIQSAMRGHMTRSLGKKERRRGHGSRDSPRDVTRRSSQTLSDSDDDSDDGIIMGGSSSRVRTSPREDTDKSPFSAKKRSTFTASLPPSQTTPPQPLPRTKVTGPTHEASPPRDAASLHPSHQTPVTPSAPSRPLSAPSRPLSAPSHQSSAPSQPLSAPPNQSSAPSRPSSAPRPAPRTHKTPTSTPTSTPPLPRPRYTTKPSIPTINVTESDSDDDVVIGGRASRSSASTKSQTGKQNLTSKITPSKPKSGSPATPLKEQEITVAQTTDSSPVDRKTASQATVKEKWEVETGNGWDKTRNKPLVDGEKENESKLSKKLKSDRVSSTSSTQESKAESGGKLESGNLALSDSDTDSDNDLVVCGASREIKKSSTVPKEKPDKELKESEERITERQKTIQRIKKIDKELEEDFRKIVLQRNMRNAQTRTASESNITREKESQIGNEMLKAENSQSQVVTMDVVQKTSRSDGSILGSESKDFGKKKLRGGMATSSVLEGDKIRDKTNSSAKSIDKFKSTSDCEKENIAKTGNYERTTKQNDIKGHNLHSNDITKRENSNVSANSEGTEQKATDHAVSPPNKYFSGFEMPAYKPYKQEQSKPGMEKEPVKRVEKSSSKPILKCEDLSSEEKNRKLSEATKLRPAPRERSEKGRRTTRICDQQIEGKVEKSNDLREKTTTLERKRYFVKQSKVKQMGLEDVYRRLSVQDDTQQSIEGNEDQSEQKYRNNEDVKKQISTEKDKLFKRRDEHGMELGGEGGVGQPIDSGLTRKINPQRTIEEASEESDQGIVFGSPSRRKTSVPRRKTSLNERLKQHDYDANTRQENTRPSKSERKISTGRRDLFSDKGREGRRRHEIEDSDDDDDDDDDVIVTPSKTNSSLSRQSAFSSSRTDGSSRPGLLRKSSKDREPVKTSGKSSHVIDDDSDEDSDDDIVTSKRAPVAGKPGSRSSVKQGKNGSFVDSLFSSSSKSRSSIKDSTPRRRSLIDDDDDSEDDEDIVVSSKSKGKSKSNSSKNKKDSLSSLWSSSSTRGKKEVDSRSGLRAFDAGFTSKRKTDSPLDELF